MGQYDQALPLYHQALAINEKMLGPDHPATATNVNNLGYLYEGNGQYDRALPLLTRALEIREKELGPEHQDTVQSVNSLGRLYSRMGDYSRALPFLERAFAIGLTLPISAERSTYPWGLCLWHRDQGQVSLAIKGRSRWRSFIASLP